VRVAFFVNFGDGNMLLVVMAAGRSLNCASCRAVEVNALAQGALRQFTQWLWIEHPTFQLGGGRCDVEKSICD